MSPSSTSAGTWDRKPGAPSPTCSSATTTRAASCPSPSRARPATCPLFITTNRPPAAVTCSTTCRRSIAFGFGLSYTTFKLENPRLAKKRIARNGSTQALVEVTNTGTRDGSEVVQLYIRDMVSSVTRPVKELKGFRRVWLEPGETTTVALDIIPGSLAFYDVNMKYVVEPGEFEIMVGTSSRDTDLAKLMLLVTN